MRKLNTGLSWWFGWWVLLAELRWGSAGFTPSDPRYMLIGLVFLFLLSLCLIASGALPGLCAMSATGTPVP